MKDNQRKHRATGAGTGGLDGFANEPKVITGQSLRLEMRREMGRSTSTLKGTDLLGVGLGDDRGGRHDVRASAASSRGQVKPFTND